MGEESGKERLLAMTGEMVKAYIKREALAYMAGKSAYDYYKDEHGHPLKKYYAEQYGVSYATFCRGIDGKSIRPDSAVHILIVLGVQPRKKVLSFITYKRTNEKIFRQPERRKREVKSNVVPLRTH